VQQLDKCGSLQELLDRDILEENGGSDGNDEDVTKKKLSGAMAAAKTLPECRARTTMKGNAPKGALPSKIRFVIQNSTSSIN
jgi:hypothetical protein